MRTPPRPGILAVATRELRRMRHDRVALFLCIGLPLLAFALLALTFSNAVIRDLRVSVVDADRTPTSRIYVQAVASAPAVTVAQRSDDLNGAMHAIRSGEAIAAVYIPPDFERDLIARKRPQIIVFYNRQFFTPGNNAASALSSAITAATASLPPTSPGLNASFEPGSLVVEEYVLTNPALNYAQFLMRAIMPTVLHVVVAIAGGYAVGSEFSRRSRRAWLRAAGGSPLAALVGKLAPLFAIFLLMMVVVALVIHVAFQILVSRRFRPHGRGGVRAGDRLPFGRGPVPVAGSQPRAWPQPDGDPLLAGLWFRRRRLPAVRHGRLRALLGISAAAALVHPNSVRPGGARTAGVGLGAAFRHIGRPRRSVFCAGVAATARNRQRRAGAWAPAATVHDRSIRPRSRRGDVRGMAAHSQ